MKEYNLDRTAKEVGKILRKELGENYITTLNDTNTIKIMHGIETMIINERGIHN